MAGNHNYRSIIVAVTLLILASSATFAEDDAAHLNRKPHHDVEREAGRDSFQTFQDSRIPLALDNVRPIEDEEGEEEGDDQDTQSDQSKFSFQHHHDEDHSIYSGRSLMSVDSIVKAIEPEHDDADAESYNEEIKPKRRPGHDRLDPLKTRDYAEKEWQLMFRNIDLMSDNIQSSVLQQIGKQTNLFEEIFSRLKPECRRDIYHIGESAKKHKLWALRMLDSNGKLPSGVTYGKFSSPGDYEECLSVKVDEHVYKSDPDDGSAINQPEHHKFYGKYCLMDFRLPLPERPRNKLLSIHDPVVDLTDTELGKQFPILKNYSGYASVFYDVGYMHAFCIPSTCDILDITKSVGKSLEGLYIIVNNTVDCEVRPAEGKPQHLRTSQVISLILVSLVLINAAVASGIQYFTPKKSSMRIGSSVPAVGTKLSTVDKLKDEAAFHSSKPNDDTRKFPTRVSIREWLRDGIRNYPFYTECFSIQTNFERLTKPDPRGLTFVHYTRIVAMALTVVTHTAGMGTLQAITKPADASNSEQIFRDLIPQMLANAFTSIQIFFFMAGFMLVISTYPSIKREKGHLSFLEYAIKRAIRLMPGLAATICLNFLWPLFADGPMLTYFIRVIVEPCETTWWRTMAFLSNFDHVEKMCIRHSYFSASDYQLHLLAFPLLILLYKQPAMSLFIAGLLTLAGFIAQVIIIITKTVLPFMMIDYIDKDAFLNVVHYIHHPVWNHMSAFFYGFIIGYLVVKQIYINLSDRTVKAIWMTVIPAGVVSIYAPYYWNHYKRPIYKWQMVLYVLIDRFTLLTCCAWLSYATMALARRKKSLKKSLKPLDLNLPVTVHLNSKEKSAEDGRDKEESVEPLPKIDVTHSLRHIDYEEQKQQSTGCTTPVSLRRQRSSPNFLVGVQKTGGDLCTQLRPALSSQDLSKPISFTDDQEDESKSKVRLDKSSSEINTTGSGARSRAPVANVNTLCLILSRLTFQLYLFNMVVLWVDVNHSKYYWYFSYYFIITKSLAVYICSSILAMIFFVTLESPSLTLYILWVKSRAIARASSKGASQKKEDDLKTNHDPQAISKRRVSKESYMSDGLQMRAGLDKPTFSFVDLSVAAQQTGGDTLGTNLTKM